MTILKAPFSVRKTVGHMVLVLLSLLAARQTVHAQSATPLISITSPKYNEEVPLGTVKATLHLRSDAQLHTLRAELNGTDIKSWFDPHGNCGTSDCDLTATLPYKLLVRGINVLTAGIDGEGDSAASARSQFEYAASSSNLSHTSNRLVAGVAINSRFVPRGGVVQILIGPGPAFPQRVYDSNAIVPDCTGNISTSAMVLVLDRQTLDPDPTIAPGTHHVGQRCFADGQQVKTFLESSSIAEGRLVIVDTIFNGVRDLDTTAIGGTRYGYELRSEYSIIGVKGAAPGQSYEVGNASGSGPISDWGTLVGSLMLGPHQRYSFIPSQFKELEVLPGEASSSVKFGGQPCTGELTGNAQGGMLLCVYDRRTGYKISTSVYATNQGSSPEGTAAFDRLTSAMANSQPDFLLVLTTIGTPFSKSIPHPISTSAANAINSLGGTANILPGLADTKADGYPHAYTLITSTDPAFLGKWSNVLEETSLFPPDTGAVQALLARGRDNRYTIENATGELFSNGSFKRLADYQWQIVGNQQMQDWPAWLPGQAQAYQDLTSNAARFPSIRTDLGCPTAEPACPEIRTYYSGAVGGGQSSALAVNYARLVYTPNNAYTEADLKAVIAQLEVEQGYLHNVQSIYKQFAALTGTLQGSIQAQLSTVANNIESSLVERNRDAAATAQNINRAAGGIRILSAIPSVGGAFGAVSSLMGALADYGYGPQDLPADYLVKLEELRNQTSQIGLDLTYTNIAFFTGIVNDWGKLQPIGGGYGAGKAPWYMCPECQPNILPTMAIPAIALGAKRSFYAQLLPLGYTLDQFIDSGAPSPDKIGGTELSGLPGYPSSQCIAPYKSAPDRTWMKYPNFGNPSRNDFFFFVYKDRGSSGYPHYRPTILFPTNTLIDDLFTQPTISNGYTLGGGAGFILNRFTSGNNKPVPVRGGWLPGDSCTPK